MSGQETININIATAEGRELLAQLARRGPVFTVRHACDLTADNDSEVTT